jgi:ATP-dependent Clp protease ATP-binding subunit ClpA
MNRLKKPLLKAALGLNLILALLPLTSISAEKNEETIVLHNGSQVRFQIKDPELRKGDVQFYDAKTQKWTTAKRNVQLKKTKLPPSTAEGTSSRLKFLHALDAQRCVEFYEQNHPNPWIIDQGGGMSRWPFPKETDLSTGTLDLYGRKFLVVNVYKPDWNNPDKLRGLYLFSDGIKMDEIEGDFQYTTHFDGGEYQQHHTDFKTLHDFEGHIGYGDDSLIVGTQRFHSAIFKDPKKLKSASKTPVEKRTFVARFQNGARLEYEIDPKDPTNTTITYFDKGQKRGSLVSKGLEFASIPYHPDPKESKSGWPKFQKNEKLRDNVKPTFIQLTQADIKGTVIIDQNGAFGHLPFVHPQKLSVTTVEENGSKRLLASFEEAADVRVTPYTVGKFGPPTVRGTFLLSPDASQAPLEVLPDFKDLKKPGSNIKISNSTLEIGKTRIPLKESPKEQATSSNKSSSQKIAEEHYDHPESIDEHPPLHPDSPAHTIGHITYEKEKFTVESIWDEGNESGTWVTRERDGKRLKMSHWHFSSVKDYMTVKDGILTIPESHRKVDLKMFDAEVRKFQATPRQDQVEIENPDRSLEVVDPGAEVHRQFKDLVEEARLHPDQFTQTVDQAIIDELAESIRSGRSAAVLGDPGVGKSTIIRAFAREVALGKVPGIPRTFRIYEVPKSHLDANASGIGVIPQRAKMMAAAGQQKGQAYFIDETHSVVSVGKHSESSINILQDWKTPMERGEFILLGASTSTEYYNAFNSDPAFLDRVDTITKKAPEGETLVEVVKAEISRLYPDAKPDTALVKKAIEYSNKMNVTTRQPRSAINLLKKTYAIQEGKNIFDHAPSFQILNQAAIKLYNADPAMFDPELAKTKLGGLTDRLNTTHIGQESAKKAVHSQWKRKITGVGNTGQFVNSLLFTGPPGGGKTSLLAEAARHMGYEPVKIRMERFQHTTQVDEFLREVWAALNKNSHSYFLLDEIEKADMAVQNAALGLLEDGKFTITETSGAGSIFRQGDARNSLFGITTNAVPHFEQKASIGFNASVESSRVVPSTRALREALSQSGMISPPILSRIPTIEYLEGPTTASFRAATARALDEALAHESKEHGVQFTLKNKNDFLDAMVAIYGENADYRNVGHLIWNEVQDTIADSILHHEFKGSKEVALTWSRQASKLHFKCILNKMGQTLNPKD